jgi:hypothetical protein
VVDIAVTALIADLRVSPPVIPIVAGDNVNFNAYTMARAAERFGAVATSGAGSRNQAVAWVKKQKVDSKKIEKRTKAFSTPVTSETLSKTVG